MREGGAEENAAHNKDQIAQDRDQQPHQPMPKSKGRTPPLPNRESSPQSQSHPYNTHHQPRHWLDYTALGVAGLAFVASSAAAVFAGWQAWIARDTEVRQLRPYLYIIPNPATITTNPDGSVSLSTFPSVKVVGQTPAAQVLPSWELKIDQYPMLSNFVFSVGYGQATALVAPGESIQIEKHTTNVSAQDVAALKAGNKRIYEAGTILYTDTFGKGRYTNFCRSADLSAFPNLDWHLCPIHNTADWYDTKGGEHIFVPYN